MNTDKILFLGCIVPRELQEEVNANNIGVSQASATEFQYKIIYGLEKNMQYPVKICNLMPVSSFPKNYKKAFIKRRQFSHSNGADDVNVGFLNVRILKQFLLRWSYKKELMKTYKGENFDKIICYSANTVLISCMKRLKKKNTSIKTCLILPDMPEFNNLRQDKSLIYNIYIRYLSKKFKKHLSFVDCFVLLTAASADYLEISKPFIVMEGIAQIKESKDLEYKEPKGKMILYTGSTNIQFGIKNLLEAFCKIETEDYLLVICGCGDYDEKIRMASESDKRIIFRGNISHDEVIELQKSATVLVNPRQNVGEYTKYSFPSKTMEYLSSGTPVVAYKLDGIPDEYDSYIHYVPDNTIETLRDVIVDVCEKDKQERETFGKRAQNFVIQNKNAAVQGKRILDLIR